MNRKKYDEIIDGQFMPFRTSNEVSLWEHCEQYINSLEQRNTELEQRVKELEEEVQGYIEDLAGENI